MKRLNLSARQILLLKETRNVKSTHGIKWKIMTIPFLEQLKKAISSSYFLKRNMKEDISARVSMIMGNQKLLMWLYFGLVIQRTPVCYFCTFENNYFGLLHGLLSSNCCLTDKCETSSVTLSSCAPTAYVVNVRFHVVHTRSDCKAILTLAGYNVKIPKEL